MSDPFSLARPSAAIAVAATFTADPINGTLQFWTKTLDWALDVTFAPFQQVFQTLLDPASVFWSNRAGYNVLLLRWEDWADPAAEAARLVDLLRGSAAPLVSKLIVAICPESAGTCAEQRESHKTIEASLRSTGVALLTARDVAEIYPVRQVHDAAAQELGHVPYTPEYFVALGTAIVRRIDALQRQPYKVIAVDCDDTLWEGVCGEDGPLGVRVDPARRSIQQLLADRRANGMLLAVASKNNESDVVETFEKHPEMLLRLDDFAAKQIHWEPKSKSLLTLANELDLGIDSFVFIDDSQKECAELNAALPQVLTLPLPVDIEDAPEFLKHVWALDQWAVTEEDRKRAQMYAQQAQRRAVAQRSQSLQDFLQTLQLQVSIGPARAEQWTRVAQLSQRTNQMNTTVIRRTVADISDLLESGWECFVVQASDRFGSYGLVGAALLQPLADRLVVDSLLMSCRALGRGIEHRLLREIAKFAESRGLQKVEIPYVEAPRNQPALDFLLTVPVVERTENTFVAAVDELKNFEYRPEKLQLPSDDEAASSTNSPVPASNADYLRIAKELRTVQQIQTAMRPTIAKVEPQLPEGTTDLEKRIAAIWAELLHAPNLGLDDDFFDLGGHSLLAVQLLSRMRKELGIDVPLDVVYSGRFTIRELSRFLEVQQFGEISPEEYAALLAELENMSDEEARALLAEYGEQMS